jgi:hypothetical protein
VLNIKGRTCSDGSGTFWDVVLSSTVTENAYNIVQGAGVGTLSLVLRQQGSAFDYMTQAEINDVSSFSRTLDVTTAVQTFIDDVGNGTGYFPEGRYRVTTITFNNQGGVFGFGNVAFEGIAATATDAVVEYTGHDTTFFDIFVINGNYNTNYTAALKWHSISGQTPAQFVKIEHLKIQNSLIGILYGQINGTTVIDGAQSENYIKVYTTAGVERAIYMNQSNGLLYINGGAYGVSIGAWEANSPGTFDFSRSRVLDQYQGGLYNSNTECIATASALSVGFEVRGGTFNHVGGVWEIAGTNMLLSGGEIAVAGLAWANCTSTTLPFIELVTATSGSLRMTNLRADMGGGATQPFIETNTTPDWNVDFSNIKTRVNRLYVVTSDGVANTYVTNIAFSNFRTVNVTYGSYTITSTPGNLLDVVPGDSGADLANLWWKDSSAGTASVDTVDVPTKTGRVYVSSMEMDGTGTDGTLWSINRTSTATRLVTGIRVIPSELYLVEGWVKHAGAGTSTLRLLTCDGALAIIGAQDIASSTGLIDTGWNYIRAIVKLGNTVEYLGIGCRALDSIVNFMDLKINRIS